MKALNHLSGLDVSFVSLVHRAAVRDPSNPTEPMRFTLTKSEVPIVDMTARGATKPEGGHMPQTETEAELRAALEKAEKDNKRLRKAEEDRRVRKAARKAKKAKPTDANPDPDHDGDDDRTPAGDTDHDYQPAPKGGAKMSKSDEIAKAEESIQKAEERAKAAEKIAKQERDLRVRSEFVKKAEEELPHLGNPDEVGAEMHRLSELLSKDEFESYVTRQRAANEQIAKGDLYRQIGRDGSPDPSTAGDLDKVRKQAAELRKADPGLSEFDAMAKAIGESPELILNNR